MRIAVEGNDPRDSFFSTIAQLYFVEDALRVLCILPNKCVHSFSIDPTTEDMGRGQMN